MWTRTSPEYCQLQDNNSNDISRDILNFCGISKLLFTYSAIPYGTSNDVVRNPAGETLV
jgi:hypothetical protein